MLAENQPAELANLLTSGRKSDVVQALETMKPLEVAWVCLRMSGYLHSQDIRMLTQYLETRIAVGKKK
jgi:hypothetical protein